MMARTRNPIQQHTERFQEEGITAQLRSDLLHRSGHEVGNPLTSIISLASIIERFQTTSEESSSNAQFAHSIAQEAWKVGSIVEKLVLLFSERELLLEALDPLALIERASSRIRNRTAFDPDDIVIRVEENDHSVCAFDEEQLTAVLSELLVNALRESQKLPRKPELGPIVRVSNSQERLCFEVTNEIDRPLPNLATLCQALQRGEPMASGVGIGLTVVARVLSRAGGFLELEEWLDAADHRYFSARAILPKATPQKPKRAAEVQAAVEDPELESERLMRILIVEDQAAVASAVEKILRISFGPIARLYCCCVDGAEALNRLETETFDAIICDLQLAQVDGRRILETLQSKRPELVSRFAFMTGGSRPEDLSSVPCLQKPFEPEELITLVSDLLR